jgi:hypothetical protein
MKRIILGARVRRAKLSILLKIERKNRRIMIIALNILRNLVTVLIKTPSTKTIADLFQ